MSGPADTTALLAYYLGLALHGDSLSGLPAVPVFDAEPDWALNPDGSPNEAGPPPAYVVVSAYMDEQQRLGPGLRWQPKFGQEPNLYSFVYVGPRQESAGGSLRAIVRLMYRQVEQVKGAFDTPAARRLVDGSTGLAGCVAAGTRITVKYDRQGPYIQYLGNLHIGCYGLVAIYELPIQS